MPLTASQVKAIRDQVGGTQAMADLLDITDRQARNLINKGAKRRSTVNRIKALVSPEKGGAP